MKNFTSFIPGTQHHYNLLASVFIFIIFILASSAGYAQYSWTKLTLPDITTVSAAAGDENYIFASTYTKLFRSTDRGATWALVDTADPYIIQKNFMRMKFSNNTLVVGTANNGTRISTDFGATWPRIFTEGTSVINIAKDGNNIIFTSRAKGIYRSTDNGVSWKLVYTQGDPQNIFASGLLVLASHGINAPVSFSLDKGDKWEMTKVSESNYFYTFAVISNKIIAAKALNNVYVSDDQCKSWKSVSKDSKDAMIYNLVVKDDNIFAATSGGIFVSSNEGESWNLISGGIDETGSSSISLCGNKLLAIVGNGLYICDLSSSQHLKLVQHSDPLAFKSNTKMPIEWTSTGITNIKIEFGYLKDNQEFSWMDIDPSYPASSGVYLFKVPQINTNEAKIRITSVTNSNLTDETSYQSVFSVSYDNSVPEIKFRIPASLNCPGTPVAIEPDIISDTTGRQITYQWAKNFAGIAPDSRITGVSGKRLGIKGLMASDSGLYTLEALVMPDNYTIISEPYMLGVTNPPVINKISQKSLSVNQGNQILIGLYLTGGKDLSYQWYRDNLLLDGQTGDTLVLENVQPSDAGAYYCAVNHACGIVYSDTVQVAVKPVSVWEDNYSGNINVTLSPNPVTDEVTFSVQGLPPGKAVINVYDIFGRLVANISPDINSAGPERSVLGVSCLPQGTYYYVLTSGHYSSSDRFVIVR